MGNRNSTALVCLTCLLLVSVRCAAQHGNCDGDQCKNLKAWRDFNSFSLRASTPGDANYIFWEGSFDRENDDIQVDVEEALSGKTLKGKILMIGGRVMAIHGPIAEPGYEIDALDGPMLELQLVEKILGRVLPNGPASVHGSAEIDFNDKKTGIQIATPSAGGTIQAPWHVVGRAKSLAPEGIQYQLTLTSRKSEGDAATRTQVLSGRLFDTTQTRIDDQLQLSAWTLFRVGPQSKKENGSTIIDYSAARMTSYKTVADVRKEIVAEDSPGEADPSKDFTGFWKTNCDDAFGLQIKHIGSEGKYSVVFCGPGGCGAPSESPPTFITKDPHYQVVGEDELRLAGGDSYYRCTKETNPVLEYKK